MSDLRQGPLGMPTAQRTALGWIISGPMGLAPCRADVAQVSHCTSDGDSDALLRKFWEDEEIQHPLPLKDEEQQCEQHFITTHSRMPNGRYMVRLPFKTGSPAAIGDSLPIATTLYARLE